MHKTPLARAGEPWWDGDTICWNDVNNAASYRAVLYRNGVHNEAVNNITGTSYKFGARISNQGLGSYTVTVQAIAADSGVYSDGPVSVSSDANVKSTTLARVDQPTWDGDTIRWKEVPDASGYRVVLYKDGSQNQSIDAAGLAHNFGARMDSQGPGSYTVSVQARGDNVIYLHGQLSVQSTANTRHPKPALERAGRPWWDGKVIRWDAVDDAARYRVVLYRNGIQNQSVEVSGAFHNFGPRIDSQGAGSYTVTVQALAVAGGAYSDGPVSLSSSANVIEQAAQGREEEPGSDLAPVPVPGTPAWVAAADESGLLSTVAWAASEESVSSYRVTLFRGTEEVTVDEIAPGEGSSGTFRLDMAGHLDEPGLYYAVIEETAGGENANTAYYQSGILVVTAETGDGSGLFRASGYLPFAGVWLQFTAQNGIIGLFTLSSFGQTDHSPPEGLYAAGIFLEIILEQTLAGTTVRLEVDYEPGFLPEEIDESSMKLYRYNMETGAWEALESGVDKAENIVWAEVDGFSLLGVFGEMLAAKEPEPAGGFSLSSFISRYRYLLLAGLFVIIFLAAGFLIYRRAKR